MKRIDLIEGLRGLLALWVVVAHIIWRTGIQAKNLSHPLQIVASGQLAVDVFIIISGFVIFYLLDTKRESFGIFITRRWFRLFPVFIVLFFVSIPASLMEREAILTSTEYFRSLRYEGIIRDIETNWRYLGQNIALHLAMLHGAIPTAVLPGSPGAFLGPAWSISLEWQFYLLAPFAFAWATSCGYRCTLLIGACFILFQLAYRRIFPFVEHGAFLPFHIEFFFIGCLSYFAYKKWSEIEIGRIPRDVIFPSTAFLAMTVYLISEKSIQLFPICLWLLIMGLIFEHPDSFSRHLANRFFLNKWVLYTGTISYSIYLCHMLVLNASQFIVTRIFPGLSHGAFVFAVGLPTIFGTILLAAILYRYIEKPGIKVGRICSEKIQNFYSTQKRLSEQ